MAAEQTSLFDVAPDAVAQPVARLSPDRRRTLRQRAQIAAGWHPLTGGRARPDLGHCGTCVHRVLEEHHGRTYPKCDVGPQSSGAATDVRRWWPACARWEASDGSA